VLGLGVWQVPDVGVGLGDLVRVEGVVVVTDDKGGDFYGPRRVD